MLNTPHELSRAVGSPLKTMYEPNQKLMHAPPNFEKNIIFAFLKASWLQIPYWVHFTFKV